MEEDNISFLPDSVVCHILSKLPSKDAVRTSILSRDWAYKWTSIYNIDVSLDRKLEIETTLVSFSCFMSRILESTLIRSIRISSSVYISEDDQFKGWLCAVFARNVENIEISVPECSNLDLTCLSVNSTLTGLNLLLNCTLKADDMHTCFANLKRLCIGEGRVEIVSEQSLDAGPILMIFPVLEDLELRKCELVSANSVEVHAPELTKFKATDSKFKGHPHTISIIGPKLAIVELPRALPDNFVIYAPGVAHAVVCYKKKEPSSLKAHAILKWFPHLQSLTLSDFVLEELVQPSEDFSLFSLCELERLELCPRHFKKEYPKLLNLQVLPSLESLDINLKHLTEYDYNNRKLHSPSILSQLREVNFINYHGSECHKNLVKYIFREGECLESASIIISSSAVDLSESEVTRNLSLFSPKSSTFGLLVYKKDKWSQRKQQDKYWKGCKNSHESSGRKHSLAAANQSRRSQKSHDKSSGRKHSLAAANQSRRSRQN